MKKEQQIWSSQEDAVSPRNKCQYSDLSQHGFSPGICPNCQDWKMKSSDQNPDYQRIQDDDDDDRSDISILDEITPIFSCTYPLNYHGIGNFAANQPIPKKFSSFMGQHLWNKGKKAYFAKESIKFRNEYIKIIKKYAKGKVNLKKFIIHIHNKIHMKLHLLKIKSNKIKCSFNYFIDFLQYQNQILRYIENHHQELF